MSNVPYNHKAIEKKWRERWEQNPVNLKADEKGSKREKYYCLDMFPYPSGNGLHVGHWRGYVISDVWSRYKLQQGYYIVHPMGWDAFGLPAENYAIKMGVHPAISTAENVKNDTYKISRPFNIATTDKVSEAAQDFIDYILSAEGQKIVEDNGYIAAAADAAAYAGGKPSGKIVVAGSSSVTPVMEKLKEGYEAVNPDAEIEIQQSDSTTGMESAISGVCDIGMASRELKDSETEAGLKGQEIALDGIAVIVNNENAMTDITSDQVKEIYTGEVTDWEDLQ